jgi:hypothetical protein
MISLVHLPAAPPDASIQLTDETFQRWFDYVRPKKEELAYQAIRWRPTLWEGVVEAQQEEKPILLWAMNGHPLACT